MLTTLIPPGFWPILARVVAYSALLGLILRAAGKAFGPTVLALSPRAYQVLARVGNAALTLTHDVVGFAQELGATDAPLPILARPIVVATGAPVVAAAVVPVAPEPATHAAPSADAAHGGEATPPAK